jgi:peptidoglycan/LPS O-acetylase OafA/YrhL
MLTAPDSTPRSRLPEINGLRGVAILGVVSFHVIAGMMTPDTLPPPLSALAISGWTGVNLFFILSGFVLFLPYVGCMEAFTGRAAVLDFYRRRAWRLLPLFYIGALGSWLIAVVLSRMQPNPGELLSVLGLGFVLDAHNFSPRFNPALWSLGDEVAFSALFPLLVVSFQRHGALRVMAWAATGALAMRLTGIWRFPALQGATFNSDMFACRIDEFVLGMALALAYARGRLPQRPALWAAVGAALVFIAWAGFDLVLREALPPICRAGLNDILDAGFAAIVLAALAPSSRLGLVLSWRPLQVAGMMCYSLYIWHAPLLAWIAPDRAQMSPARFIGAMAVFLSLTVALSALTYRFVEFRRVRDWRRLFLLPLAARTA